MTDRSAGLEGGGQARRDWSKRGAGTAMLVWLVFSVSCGSQATADTTSRELAFDQASRGAQRLFGFGTTGAVIPNGTRHLTEARSEERRVGKEGRSRRTPYH